jgi:hypothetical protein
MWKFVLMVALLCVTVVSAWAAEPAATTGPESDWAAPELAAVKARAFAWLDQWKADAGVRAKAEALWAKLSPRVCEVELLQTLAETFALADENAARLCALCAKPKEVVILPEQKWLAESRTPPFVAQNLRVWYGRWLVHNELFEEALEQLSGLKAEEVVAPATMLFYRGVAQHSLLEKKDGLNTLARLLRQAEASPRRYVALARLMEEDLKRLEDDSLDHIARRMNDVRRRLDLGRAGRKVRSIEDGIIESIDKLIRRLEQQQQGGGSAASGGSGQPQDNIRSSSPAPDSVPIGGKGSGEIDKKNVGEADDWGALPPKEREEALQNLGREFPSHYRDVIEQYFRKLAAEKSD